GAAGRAVKTSRLWREQGCRPITRIVPKARVFDTTDTPGAPVFSKFSSHAVALDCIGIEREAETRAIGHSDMAIFDRNALPIEHGRPRHVFEPCRVGKSPEQRDALLGEKMVGYGDVVRGGEMCDLDEFTDAA